MRTYELRFPDGLETRVERLQFEAENAAKALSIAESYKGSRRMELWEDGRKLCELRGSPVNGRVWIVRGAGGGNAPEAIATATAVADLRASHGLAPVSPAA